MERLNGQLRRRVEGLEKTEGFPSGTSSLSFFLSISPFPSLFRPINHSDFSLTNSFPAGSKKTVIVALSAAALSFSPHFSCPCLTWVPVWPVLLSLSLSLTYTFDAQFFFGSGGDREGGNFPNMLTMSLQDRNIWVTATPHQHGNNCTRTALLTFQIY